VPTALTPGTGWPFSLSDEADTSVVVIDDGQVKVTAFKVDHAPVSPAVGYRFDYKGRSLVISGDTKPCNSLEKQSEGVDVLFHEALQPSMIKMIHDQAGLSPSPSISKITADIPGYHTSPEDAARIAQRAGVERLVLYHILPPLPAVLNTMFLGHAARYYSGPVTIAEDGMLISLPANSDKISVRQLLR
jgi:ribonuclease Z